MDRGWSWVICSVAFITQLLTNGFCFAIGIYYVEFLSVFNESKAKTAWISALHVGVFMGIGDYCYVFVKMILVLGHNS